jgi:pimeloyl-ACP methyl ester carboxylesterase
MKRQCASFVLIPGAGGIAWYWHRLVAELEDAGLEAIAVDLPGDDESAGLEVYADLVVRAIDGRTNTVLVAQSLGGFTAALVCRRVSVSMLVFVNAMIPLPGETAGAWWENTGAVEARVAEAKRCGYGANFDIATYFLHDVPAEAIRGGEAHQREEAEIVFTERCEFAGWPPIPIHVVAGRDDRFFPLRFQKRVARSRLKKNVDLIPGGHLVALSNPRGLADQLRALESEMS